MWWQDVLHTVIITVIAVSIQFVLGMLPGARHAPGDRRARAGARGRAGPVRDRRGRGRVLVELRLVAQRRLDPAAARARRSDPLSHQFGIYVAIIITEIWKNTPFMALLLLAGLALVPDELHEAAKVDGASTWQRFVRITLPLMKPAILVALLFRTLDAFRIFDMIYIFGQGAQGHGVDLDAQLLDPAQPAQPRAGLGGVGAAVRARRR